jgi:hypothetical protein|tara:strand:+ start:670 stop:954 length:285 start_codon:yes stop_codon:yes gene_type:complete
VDFVNLIETFGLPVAGVIGLAIYVSRQNKWIQETLMQELEESQNRTEGILIKLIDQQKRLQTDEFPDLHKELARLEGSYHSIVRIISSLKQKNS